MLGELYMCAYRTFHIWISGAFIPYEIEQKKTYNNQKGRKKLGRKYKYNDTRGFSTNYPRK